MKALLTTLMVASVLVLGASLAYADPLDLPPESSTIPGVGKSL